MIIVWALSWWFGAGWKERFLYVKQQLERSYDYFSISLLLRTLFAPYRQISAGKVNGPIGVKLRAFADRQISRVIGAAVRLVLIVAGVIWMTMQLTIGVVSLALWPVIPFFPLVGFIGFISGWVPLWR